MKRRTLLVIVLMLAVCATAYLFAVAKKSVTIPDPMRIEIDCWVMGGVCRGAEVHPCQIGEAQSCYRWILCGPDQNFYEYYGEDCCHTCEYPRAPL